MQAVPVGELLLERLGAGAHAGMPAHRRLFEALRDAVLRHALPGGARLPSTRDLSRELGLSRNTVLAAYDQLLAEGYVEGRSGSGTYVADTLPGATASLGTASTRAVTPVGTTARLSQRGQALIAQPSDQHFELREFVAGANDFSSFPHALWLKLQARYWRRCSAPLLDYSHTGGDPALRAALADYLRMSRSVRTSPEQILITSGTQQSIDLCARLLSDHGDMAWMEDPGYWAAQRLLTANGLQLRPIGVDDEGINPQAADWHSHPRLIYVTPSHQYPCDVVMSLARRRALIDFAARSGAWILEDDYDSEFRHEGRPLASLQGLDDAGRVIYMGTFSKIMYPGIRIAYVVVPEALVKAMRVALYDLQRPGQMAVQAALADFIREGHFTSHIRNLRKRYGACRNLLRQTLVQTLKTTATVSSADTGMHLVIHLPHYCDDVAMCREAASLGLDVRALSGYYLSRHAQRGIVVGYGYTPIEQIVVHARLLAQLVNRALRYAD